MASGSTEEEEEEESSEAHNNCSNSANEKPNQSIQAFKILGWIKFRYAKSAMGIKFPYGKSAIPLISTWFGVVQSTGSLEHTIT